jgi:hypothetical protein
MLAISYEFRCFLLIALIWIVAAVQRRRVALSLTLALLAAYLLCGSYTIATRLDHAFGYPWPSRWFNPLVGIPTELVRMTAAFMVGATFCVYRAELLPRLTSRSATSALVVMLPLMFFKRVADVVQITLGDLPFFWVAFKAQLGSLRTINDKWDIIYGT